MCSHENGKVAVFRWRGGAGAGRLPGPALGRDGPHNTHSRLPPSPASPAAHLLLALPQPALQGNWREKRIGIIKSNYTNGGLHLPTHRAAEISTNMSPTYVKYSFANKKSLNLILVLKCF